MTRRRSKDIWQTIAESPQKKGAKEVSNLQMVPTKRKSFIIVCLLAFPLI